MRLALPLVLLLLLLLLCVVPMTSVLPQQPGQPVSILQMEFAELKSAHQGC
jgi:hypothetical protein